MKLKRETFPVNESPTKAMIENCELMGWAYLGDGLFERDGALGYFINRNFVKV